MTVFCLCTHWIIFGVAYCSNTTQSWPLLMLPNDLFCAHSWHRLNFRYSNSFYRAGRKPFNPLLGETFDYVDLDRKCVFLFYRTALIRGCPRFAFRGILGNSHHIALWFGADQNFGDCVWSNFRLSVAKKICGSILTFIIPLTNGYRFVAEQVSLHSSNIKTLYARATIVLLLFH